MASQIQSLILLDGDVHVSLPTAQECWGWLLLTGVGLDCQWIEKQHCLVPVTMVNFKKQRRMPSFQHKQEIHSPGIHEVMVSQRAKKVVSDSPGLVDLLSGKWILFLTCSMGNWYFFRNLNNRRTVINPAHQIFFRLIEMTFGLVHASYSLPEWQAVKLTFFAPCGKQVQ